MLTDNNKIEYTAIIFRNVDDFGIMVEINHNKKKVSYYVRDYKHTVYDYWLYIFGTCDDEDYEEYNRYIYKREINEFIESSLDYAVKEFIEMSEIESFS